MSSSGEEEEGDGAVAMKAENDGVISGCGGWRGIELRKDVHAELEARGAVAVSPADEVAGTRFYQRHHGVAAIVGSDWVDRVARGIFQLVHL